MTDDEATLQRRIVDLECEVLAQKAIVDLVEKQRDRAETFLRGLLAAVDPQTGIYVRAQRYLGSIIGKDKFERRLEG
jgi:16S rRNA G1207 methylase RsmC